MKSLFPLWLAALASLGLMSCTSPYDDMADDDDDDGDRGRTVTTERVGVDPYTGATHSEVTTRVMRGDDD